MNEQLATSVLRILGITIVVIGAVLTVQALIGILLLPDDKTVSALGEYVALEFGRAERAQLLMQVATMAFGFLLCALSPALARYVAKRGTEPGSTSPPS